MDRPKGLERYVRQPTLPTRDASVIDRANTVPVRAILADFARIEVPESPGWKFGCPQAWEHLDGGASKACKVYEQANVAYCFALHGGLTPVRLVVAATDLPPKRAAYRILENYGLLRPRGYRQRYEEILRLQEAKEEKSDLQTMVGLLHRKLSTDPTFASRQYDPDVQAAVQEALEQLQLQAHSVDTLREWLRAWETKIHQTVRNSTT